MCGDLYYNRDLHTLRIPIGYGKNTPTIMTTQIVNSPSTFVFWLFDWSTHSVSTSLRYYPRYIRCDIDETGISIYESFKPIRILYTQVKSCEIYRFSQGLYAGPTNNVKLELATIPTDIGNTVSGNQLYLVPVNLFHNEPRTPEMEDMIKVINSFRSGKIPLLPRNPYERELIRLGRANEFDVQRWDPLTPPNVYTPVRNPILILLKTLLIAAIATLVILLLIGIIYNLFN